MPRDEYGLSSFRVSDFLDILLRPKFATFKCLESTLKIFLKHYNNIEIVEKAVANVRMFTSLTKKMNGICKN